MKGDELRKEAEEWIKSNRKTYLGSLDGPPVDYPENWEPALFIAGYERAKKEENLLGIEQCYKQISRQFSAIEGFNESFNKRIEEAKQEGREEMKKEIKKDLQSEFDCGYGDGSNDGWKDGYFAGKKAIKEELLGILKKEPFHPEPWENGKPSDKAEHYPCRCTTCELINRLDEGKTDKDYVRMSGLFDPNPLYEAVTKKEKK